MGDATSNKLLEYMAEKNYTHISLTEFYDSIYGEKMNDDYFPDSTGSMVFKDWVRMIYFTGYTGILTDEEQEEILQNGRILLRLSFKISSNSYRYVYEFYRNDDRRIMVRIYQADEDGNLKTTPVSDFYVSTFAFRKIVRNMTEILDGKIIDTDMGYEK